MPWLALVFVSGWAITAWVVGLETAPEVLSAPEASVEPPVSVVAAAVATSPPTVRVHPKRRAEFDLPQIVTEPLNIPTPEFPPHPRPLAVHTAALGLAFLAYVAAGGLVPGGLALERERLSTTHLAEFVALSAAIAGAVGYRLASLTTPHRFDRIVRVVAVGQYALPIAVAAAVLRWMALPRLFIPALLTLVTYVVTVVRESPEPVPRNRRLLQELAVFGVAALAVIVWGLQAR
jgi:ABC-type sugar transport system permease subunit